MLTSGEEKTMNATGIEYLDSTWSPFVGCSGLGCAAYDVCWAKYMKKRKLTDCQLCYEFKPHTHFERLEQPLHVKSSKLIGACYSSDFWDKGFHWNERHKVFNVAALAMWHWFINLTKQTQNIQHDEVFPNNWIQGASICTEKDLYRVSDLWKTRAKLLALSVEPLYQRLPNLVVDDLAWVIIGGQTHPLKLPEKAWVDEIITKCRTANVPVFIKNNLNVYGYNLHEYPKALTLSGSKST